MRTAVVILNWNTKGYLRDFLPGLIASTKGMDAEVIVADSASTDGSLEMLSQEFPAVRQIPLDKNYGFTGGYNRALAQVEADYFVLINSDIEVPESWLRPLVAWMDAHPECGACGPKLLSWHERDRFEYAGAAGGLLDRYGYPFCRGRVMSRVEKDEGQYDAPADVFWVSGACLLVRSLLWKQLGGLDDRFFAHMEEIDLCWRLQLAGYRIDVVPESVVWHIGGGTLPNNSPFKLRPRQIFPGTGVQRGGSHGQGPSPHPHADAPGRCLRHQVSGFQAMGILQGGGQGPRRIPETAPQTVGGRSGRPAKRNHHPRLVSQVDGAQGPCGPEDRFLKVTSQASGNPPRWRVAPSA